MADLRERLALATGAHSLDPNWSDADNHSRCVCGDWVEGEMEPGWDDHMADVSAAVFAEWLRERAEREHDPDCDLGRRELQHYPGEKVCAHFDARWRRDFAIALADEIAAEESRG